MTFQVSEQAVAEVVREYLRSKQPSDQCAVLHSRGRCGRGMLLRVRVNDDVSVIAKVWRVRNTKERFKRRIRISNACREWRAHRRVQQAGLVVPEPLAFFNVSVDARHDHEVMVVEDLGSITRGMVYLKTLIRQGDSQTVADFEQQVLDMTALLVRSRVMDVDHQLNNIVVNGTGRAVRIDLECARPWLLGRMPSEAYATMLARLVCSHVYASQPALEWSESFAQRLMACVRPPEHVLTRANERVERILARQREKKGVDSRLQLA